MTKVFVVNKSNHDFSDAEKYGELIFMSEGIVNRFSTNNMIRQFQESMANSTEEDLILLCSLNVMNSIACAIFAHKHGRVNLLLFKESSGRYIERRHVL
jgi:hypothetical protein